MPIGRSVHGTPASDGPAHTCNYGFRIVVQGACTGTLAGDALESNVKSHILQVTVPLWDQDQRASGNDPPDIVELALWAPILPPTVL